MKTTNFNSELNQLRAIYAKLECKKNILHNQIQVLEDKYYDENTDKEEKRNLYYEIDEKVVTKNGVVDALNQIGNAIEHLGGGYVKAIFE